MRKNRIYTRLRQQTRYQRPIIVLHKTDAVVHRWRGSSGSSDSASEMSLLRQYDIVEAVVDES
ncbi:hypothetical protein J6590_000628 [Homalodisca vitripennis]|nr:hypothetical protein J6590_000628 [Homalodisca vitripennis]